MSIINTQDKNLQLLISSLAIYMRKHQNFFSTTQPAEALDKLIELYQANLVTPTGEAESMYLKDLLAAKPANETFETLKQHVAGMMNQFFMADYLEVCVGLKNLKFSDEQIFHKLKTESAETLRYIKNFWDPVKNFIVEVSYAMTNKQKTMDEAIKAVEQDAMNNNLPNYIRKVRAHDVYYFLSPEAMIQLYQHARVNLIMGGGNQPYVEGLRDDASLRKIAIFHTQHQDKIYLATDYALRNLNFTAAESLALLESHADLSAITKLNETIALAPQLLTRIPVSQPASATGVAPAPVVNNVLPVANAANIVTAIAPVSLPVAATASALGSPMYARSVPRISPMHSGTDVNLYIAGGLAFSSFLLMLAVVIPSRCRMRFFSSKPQVTLPLPAATRDDKRKTPTIRR